jgi:hypothetical protein
VYCTHTSLFLQVRVCPLLTLAPRDLCLLRYWRVEEDGSILIFFQVQSINSTVY